MINETSNKIIEYVRSHRIKKRRTKILVFLAAVVVFCTTYALILPAITMEKDACKLPEHTHSAQGDCYNELGVLVCSLEEHTHTAQCKGTAKLTDEEQAQVDEVIALIDALPDFDEISAKLEDFEDAGDDDGYSDYLAYIFSEIDKAYEAYNPLTEDQKLKVTNAEKLLAFESIRSVQTMDLLTGDEAYVTGLSITKISDGTEPFDSDNEPGNDKDTDNRIVRSFDTINYNFEVGMLSYDQTKNYSEARIKMEFVLPLTADQAEFDMTAMAWMDNTEGYKPVLKTEKRVIDGKETVCQVLTCYKYLLPSPGNNSVVPGRFGENVSINVKGMKNGDIVKPIFSAAMEYGSWDGACTKHPGTQEKYTTEAAEVKVTAAPKFNIQVGMQTSTLSAYKDVYDFSSGNDLAKGYGDGYMNYQVTGRSALVGITLQLYNEIKGKGFRGIEIPNGDDITFDIELHSTYQIRDTAPPNGHKQGETVDVMDNYMPLLWSCDGNKITRITETNSDGRYVKDYDGHARDQAPLNVAKSATDTNGCYNGGTWTATQEGNIIHITVSGYKIDMSRMPTTNSDGAKVYYGENEGIGCFSAGELWIVQPYNKLGSNSAQTYTKSLDIMKDYGEGIFATNIVGKNMKVTSLSGTTVCDANGTNNAQMNTRDDQQSASVELLKQGALENRVRYASWSQPDKIGVGTNDLYNGLDFASPGETFALVGGFSYNPYGEVTNRLLYGVSMVKFYGSAIEIDLSERSPYGKVTQQQDDYQGFRMYYITKPDGTDWEDDNQLLYTREDRIAYTKADGTIGYDLSKKPVMYNNFSDIPEGHLCVGLMFTFERDERMSVNADNYFLGYVPAKIRNDMSLAGNTYMIASHSRVWTDQWLNQLVPPDWSDPKTNLKTSLPTLVEPNGYYEKGNLPGRKYYEKTIYYDDGTYKDHNSDWSRIGDTMLIIGYKAEIAKSMPQRDNNNNEKNTYNLDDGQRVVDFMLHPEVRYDKSGNGDSQTHELLTTVTVVDTLPKYLRYRKGSCYFGGEYQQTSLHGGTQGNIDGGKKVNPTSVVINDDGTETITWVIEDVVVGKDMPVIYYSADIGTSTTEPLPSGTTNLLNKVAISATHDNRAPTLLNRNYAEAGFSVVRGYAISFGKESVQDYVDTDAFIDYIMYYDNNSASPVNDVLLLDTMPYDGDKNGSSFDGEYSVSKWKLNVAKCSPDTLTFYYTTDEKYKGATITDLGGKDKAIAEIQKNWIRADSIAADGTVDIMNGKQPAAWALTGSLGSKQEIYVDLRIDLPPKIANDENKVITHKYVNTLSVGDMTTTTENETVNRTLEGLTWLDMNQNGIKDELEDDNNLVTGVLVTLMKLKPGGDPTNEKDYEDCYYPDSDEKIQIFTGQTVSVAAKSSSEATEYDKGCYKFVDLPAGTFAVRFEDGTFAINGLIASPPNRTDEKMDSDGIPVYKGADKAFLERTVILGINMPEAEEMTEKLYESKYHDSGFYYKGHELPSTGGSGAAVYYVIGALLVASAGFSMVYNIMKRRKEAYHTTF